MKIIYTHSKSLFATFILCGILLVNIRHVQAQTYNFKTPQGYGAGTTGGGDATPITVTTQADLMAALIAPGPAVILVSGTIQCPYTTVLANDKTILGLPGARLVNPDQTKEGSGILNLKPGSSNVIIRNLIFESAGAYDTDGRDNFCISGGIKVWVDHCEFQDGVDGNFDTKALSDNITVTWCKFTYLKPPKSGGSGGTADHRFSDLVGSNDSDKPADGKFSMTWQYCWWASGCVERMVRARNAQLHMLNCYWNSQQTKVALGLGGVTDCYVENSVFANSGQKYDYYDNGTVRLTTVGCTSPPANVGTCPAPSYTHEAIAASAVVKAITGSCGAGATLKVSPSGVVTSACDVTGIFSSDYKTFTNVYPNPFTDAFTVKASQDIKNLSVVTVYGEEVINLQNISTGQQLEIGKDLAQGTYVLRINYSSERTETTKIIKVK